MTISVVVVPAIDSIPLQLHHVSWDTDCDSFCSDIQALIEDADFLETPLVRPREGIAGLYAYFNNVLPQQQQQQQQDSHNKKSHNIRATRLAMACGLLSKRFCGNVLFVRSFGGRWEDLTTEMIRGACCISPDLRTEVQDALSKRTNNGCGGDDNTPAASIPPSWLADAAQQNYHDGAELAKVFRAMNIEGQQDKDASNGAKGNIENSANNNSYENGDDEKKNKSNLRNPLFVAKSPLCLHCRGPTNSLCNDCKGASLCNDCKGAYFCDPPRGCRQAGWSHSCLCPTWKYYSSHRTTLSSFSFLGEWHTELMGREFQIHEQPYEDFLKASLRVTVVASTTAKLVEGDVQSSSWWRTELYGWAGGTSASAYSVDPSIRRSYAEGFDPVTDIPTEKEITSQDWQRAGLQHRKNEVGLYTLKSWEEYYRLRNLPSSSPVALLATFPLTIYYAIEQYGQVPVTVSRMLKRPLRVHIVGAEKEMHFLDLFKEVGFLLRPELRQLELIFVVRQDMLPSKLSNSTRSGGLCMKTEMISNLLVDVVSGTYGDSLDPNFDCGTGPPDMVIALNAGLYAYESWRSVVTYLYKHPSVVGVFTDYNEYSGVQCAALGGEISRNSLQINPFRQPRAMPVYSMNLPQFSNGFIYVFNGQELEF